MKKCADLIPEWAVSHAVLGIYYYATGQIAKVREMLNRYMELSPQGGLNVKRIQEILASTSVSETQSSDPKPLSPESRHQFLQLVLALLEQDS